MREVELADSKLTDDGLDGPGALKQVFRLDLSNTAPLDADPKKLPKSQVTDAGLTRLNGCEALTTLRLNRTRITGAGLNGLGGLTHLAELHLEQCPLAEPQMIGLSRLKALRTVNLAKTPLTGEGLFTLGDIPTLETVLLDGAKITDAGLKQIAAAKDITELSLRETAVTGVAPEWKNFRRLARLDLSHTRVNDSLMKHLANIKTLEIVTLAETGVTGAGYRAMLKTNPECRLLFAAPKPATPAAPTTAVARTSRLPAFTD